MPPRPNAPRLPPSAAERISGGAVDAERLREEGLQDVLLERVDLANLRGVRVLVERATFRGCRMTGIQLAESTVRDALFESCQIDLAAFRMTRFERVVLRDCVLREVDLVEAQLSSVVLERCDLTAADLSHATFARSELHGCRCDGLVGAERLRGTAMPWADVIALAPELAASVGIAVLDVDGDANA
jgi:uncharacterized protein YjbI with pentapeptide repeats